MSVSSFEEFCGSPIWNETGLTDNRSFPHFTPCFQKTVLAWIPCGWLWLTLPVNIYLTKTSTASRLPVTPFNISKLMLDIILVVLTSVDTGLTFVQSVGDFPDVVWVTGTVDAVTYGLAAVYTQLDRIRGSITSTSLFLFWLLKVVCNLVEFYTRILTHGYEIHKFRFILFYFIYGILVIQLVLHCFAERPAPNSTGSESDKESCPEGKASILNLLYFWWMNSIVVKAFKQPLKESDLWTLLSRDQSQNIVKEFEKNWKKELTKTYQRNQRNLSPHIYDVHQTTSSSEKTPLLKEHLVPVKIVIKPRKTYRPSLFRALCNSFGWTYLLSLWFKFLSDILQFAGPLLISLLIDYADHREEKPDWKGYLPAIGIFVASVVQSVLYHQNYKFGLSVGMRVRCSLISAIYKKALTMDSDAKKASTLGQIVSLMSIDCQRIQDTFTYLWSILSVPVQVGIGIYFLWGIVGISCLAGLAVLLLLVPLNTCIGFKQTKLTVEVLALKGERIKMMNQILSGIKVLKMYAWEPSFTHQILAIRRIEMKKLLKVAYLQGITTFGWLLAPFMVTLATFATYVTLTDDHYLSSSTAFVALALFNVLRIPVNTMAQTISSIIQARVSLKRVSDFLSGEDLDPGNVQHVFDTDYAIKIRRGTFTWNKQSPQSTLRDINITIPDGQLVAVVGQVGAGKSSLVSAILGELMKIDGHVSLKGSVAYVPQEAWIQNATVMNNILFGKTFMQKKYKRVLEACSLTADLDILPGRDLTEIGEKGINISGGQKQRVSLARAVYSNSDVYLMDDPLSAVDAHVGKHIFEQVIGNKGLLKNKTRLLVTHGIHWLPMVDNIIVMVKGKITEMGAYEDLINHDGPFAQFLKEYFIEEEEENVEDPEIKKIRARILEQVESVTSDGMTSDEPSFAKIRQRRKANKERETATKLSPQPSQMCSKSTLTRLTQDEQSQIGGIKFSVYSSYAKALGKWATMCVFFVFSLYHAASVYANFWLTFWTTDSFLTNQTNIGKDEFFDKVKYYLLGYGILGVIQAVLVFIYAILSAVRMVYAAMKLHEDLLSKVMRASMEFFDTTPVGRIINRFSSDIDVLDVTLPLTFRITINSVYLAVTTLIVISINTPIILTTVVPIAIVYGLIMIFYIPTSRQLKRLESVNRSPIYNHFSETIAGASVIRAYKATERFMSEALERLDKNMVFYYAFLNAARWLGVRLEMMGNILVLAAALFSIFSGLNGAVIGLSVVYAIQATYVLNLLVMNLSDLQSNIVCVERIKEYTDIDTEGNWRSDRKPPSDWPRGGNITFKGYKMRYRSGTELVLRGIDLKIYHNEKIGIVGRTGAGKSSMALALFRLVEAAEGEIRIDGIKISDMGLHDLREKITILPQDPVLFSGSLRMNLDPFGNYCDDKLWTALQQAHLKDFVLSLPGHLDYQCGEGGQNLSVGQRQLVCLARTLLKDTKILVLDEATAAVDLATDELIQQTIFQEFRDCTVISIAHRLKTVLDYDRIVVMDRGLVREFDTPDNLLSNENSMFYGLAKEAGVTIGLNSGHQEQLEARSEKGTNLPKAKSKLSTNEQLEKSHLDLPLVDQPAEDYVSDISSNGIDSSSGNEGSAEWSNDALEGSSRHLESSSVDSVRFGDVTIVTQHKNPPPSPYIISDSSSSTPVDLNLKDRKDSDSLDSKHFPEFDSSIGEQTSSSKISVSSGNSSDETVKNLSPVKMTSQFSESSATQFSESSLSSSSQDKDSASSVQSDYLTADSQSLGEKTVTQSVNGSRSSSSGSETGPTSSQTVVLSSDDTVSVSTGSETGPVPSDYDVD